MFYTGHNIFCKFYDYPLNWSITENKKKGFGSFNAQIDSQ